MLCIPPTAAAGSAAGDASHESSPPLACCPRADYILLCVSGHSKWATIKHKKSSTDAKRGKLFAKLIKQVGSSGPHRWW